jgi:hypothetical protein
MPRKHSLKIDIPTPCTENWENMTPNEHGRHCASCNKTVIDFSLYTDKQLIEFFSKVTGNICGRIPAFQLQRQLVYTEPQNHFLHKLLLGSALTIGLAGSANGNYNPNRRPIIEQYVNNNNYKNKQIIAGDSASLSINVMVIDSATNAAIPFASILITYNGAQIGGGQTDTSGSASIDIPDLYAEKKVELKIFYPGYHHPKTEFIARKAKEPFIIKISDTGVLHTVGALIISEPPAFDNSNGWDKQTLRRGDTPYR